MRAVFVSLMVWMFAGCAATAEPGPTATEGPVPAPAVTALPAAPQPSPAALAAAAATQDDEYRIGANDLLEISVFQVKELDRTVRVNSRGLISLPLIGVLSAAGKSATDLENQIAAKLKEDYLQDPQVTVFIKEFTSQRVTVEGQVEKTGVYPITGRMTLLQALALAGGLKDLSDTKVHVFRLEETGSRQMLAFEIEQIREGVVPDPTMKNNDIVVVGKNATRSFIKSLTDALRGFVSFGAL